MYPPQYQQYPVPPPIGQYPPPQFQNYPQQPPVAQPTYDPSRPQTVPSQASTLFCHLPRPFGVYAAYVAAHEETLIVQNPCDFRTEEVTIANSNHQPLFRCSGLLNSSSHGKGAQCIIRSVSGQDLLLVRHHADRDYKHDNARFLVEDPNGNRIASIAGRDVQNGNVDAASGHYNVYFTNRLNHLQPDEDVHLELHGDMMGDSVDWTFEGTHNRVAMLRNNWEQSGIRLREDSTGTRVAAGFDLAVVAGLQVVMDCHDTELREQEEQQQGKTKVKKKGKTKKFGKGLMKAAGALSRRSPSSSSSSSD